MGTMTFGRQNTLEEGVEQLALAFDKYGVNFLDTAEMYPVPTTAESAGLTDKTVAAFLKTRKREDVILATKVSGTSDRINWLRGDGETFCKLNKEQIAYSIDASLKRLETDYIDLIQVHWPDRYVGGLFGQPDYQISKETTEKDSSFEEQLTALNDAVKAGKVRAEKAHSLAAKALWMDISTLLVGASRTRLDFVASRLHSACPRYSSAISDATNFSL